MAVLVVTLLASATRYIVVVALMLIRFTIGLTAVVPLVPVESVTPRYVVSGLAGSVAEVVVIPAAMFATTVVAAGRKSACPQQSQSPAVRPILVALTVVPLVIDVPDPDADWNSPTAPAAALLAFVTPVMDGVVMVGDIASTMPPEPVTADPSAVPTPVPRPDTPVEMGSPVAFVRVAADGVPRLGVVRTGEVANTTEPEPVEAVNEYVPAPVRDMNPVLEKPAILSRQAPLAVEQFVPPLDTGTTPVSAVAEMFPHDGALDTPLDTIA